MIYEINNREDDIDTFKSSFYPPIKNHKNVIIPYFNVGISNHKFNPDCNLKYVNFCYLLLINVTVISVDEYIEKTTDDLIRENNSVIVFLGGINAKSELFEETGYIAEEMFLQTIDDVSKLSEEVWKIKVDDFLRFSIVENLPNNLRDILNGK